jgi:transcriptional regulator with XRE-family HTH domain
LPEVGDNQIDMFYIAVGKKVRTTRNDAGLSQTMLAQRIGFTRSSVANLEAGRQRIALHLFVLIAQALGTEPATLLPESTILEHAGPVAPDKLREHLAGTPETTQDFVRRAVAQVTPSSLRVEP